MTLKEKFFLLLLGIILIISAVVRFEQTKKGQFPFTYDQARDMLDIRALGEFRDLWVMGPTTSINGLRLGPFYYYSMLPAYWLGDGNPQALVNWNIVLFLISGMAIFWFFRKRNVVLGTMMATIYLMAPRLFDTTRYFWNANSAVYLSVYYFLALYFFLEKKSKTGVFWLVFTSAMLLQFEAAFGIVCLLFSGLIILINKKTKYRWEILWGLLPWFLPQIILEIKNKFQMSKLLLGMFLGSNQVLGEKMRTGEVVLSHFSSLSKVMEGQFILPHGWGFYLLIAVVLLAVFLNKKDKILNYFLGFLFFAFAFYVLIYHHQLKEWYLDSFRVWYIFVFALAWQKIGKKQLLINILLILFLIRSFNLTVTDLRKSNFKAEQDNPKNFSNLLENLDRVYQKTEGGAFDAYNYVPEIYDYQAQYLYWWYGNKKYGYSPNKISYSLSPVPEYVKAQDQFLPEQKKNDQEKIALIYETKRVYSEWLNQFNEYCIDDSWQAMWGTIVQVRHKCH